jgi:hypothetical protein
MIRTGSWGVPGGKMKGQRGYWKARNISSSFRSRADLAKLPNSGRFANLGWWALGHRQGRMQVNQLLIDPLGLFYDKASGAGGVGIQLATLHGDVNFRTGKAGHELRVLQAEQIGHHASGDVDRMTNGVGAEADTTCSIARLSQPGISLGIEDVARSLIQGDLAPRLAITHCRNARRDSISGRTNYTEMARAVIRTRLGQGPGRGWHGCPTTHHGKRMLSFYSTTRYFHIAQKSFWTTYIEQR